MEVVDDDDEDAAGRVAARPVARKDDAVTRGDRRTEHVELAPAVDHRERRDRLLDPVLVDLQLSGLQISDELSAGVANDGVGGDEIDVDLEGWLVLPAAARPMTSRRSLRCA